MTAPGIALVTGGSTGIGAEICRQMLQAGYEVVSLARRKPSQAHAKLHAVEVDLMDAAATGQAATDVVSRFAITHVVHNAGVIRPALLADVELDDLQALSQLHLGAAIALVQAALPAMKKNRFGRIVLMSSRGALGLATRTAYAATKAGMVGMSRALASELGPHGITVNVVAPGIIDTVRGGAAGARPGTSTASKVPVGREGRPEEIAHARRVIDAADEARAAGRGVFALDGKMIDAPIVAVQRRVLERARRASVSTS